MDKRQFFLLDFRWVKYLLLFKRDSASEYYLRQGWIQDFLKRRGLLLRAMYKLSIKWDVIHVDFVVPDTIFDDLKKLHWFEN